MCGVDTVQSVPMCSHIQSLPSGTFVRILEYESCPDI